MFMRRDMISLWCAVSTIALARATAHGDPPAAPIKPRAVDSQLFRMDTAYLMSLLRRDVVQSELKLSDAHKAEVVELERIRVKDLRRLFEALQAASEKEKKLADERLQRAVAAHASSARKFIDEELSKPQIQRLKQIYWQQIGPAAFSDRQILAELSLTAAQVKAMTVTQAELQTSRLEDLRKQAKAGAPRRKNAKGPQVRTILPSAAFTQQAMEKLTAVLTDEQRERFAAMLGPPLEMEQSPANDRAAGDADQPEKTSLRTEVAPQSD